MMKKKYTPTINVIGQLSNLMMGRVIFPKYLDPGSPMVDVHIDDIIVPHTLIDIGAAINVKNKETNLKLNLQGSLREKSTVLQLADRSTVAPERVVENVMVSIDPWEYPTDFLILRPNTKFNGCPLILGIPWLATGDAYISCRVGNMTIKNGHLSKQLVLYPPAQPSLEHDLTLWLEEEEEYEVYHMTSHPICTLDVVIRGGNLMKMTSLTKSSRTSPLTPGILMSS